MELGFGEILFILLLALLFFGPKKLPEIGRAIGKAVREFRRAYEKFMSEEVEVGPSEEIDTSPTSHYPINEPSPREEAGEGSKEEIKDG